MTGFGRTGPLFACSRLEFTPDLICLSKGISGGFLPMGVTVAKEPVFASFLSPDFEKAFLHGHSYSGNPLACAAANASLDLLLQPGCEASRKRIESQHRAFQKKWEHCPQWSRCEVLGTLLIIEYKAQEASYFHPLGRCLKERFQKEGILIRPFGNVLYLLPPLLHPPRRAAKNLSRHRNHSGGRAMIRGFVSFQKEIAQLLGQIVENPPLHGLWLNTLSYLENCGARRIAACEHPTQVKEEMLKHAAEEFRHAFYLKSQLTRIGEEYEDYRRSALLGSWPGYHYLNRLDLQACRYLHSLGLPSPQIKQLAYLLVTYAIELRAGELYPIYQSALRRIGSKVQVQSILLEEKEHLQEMEEELERIPASCAYIEAVCRLEAVLFQRWITACCQSC